MLDYYFRRREVINRLRTGPSAQLLEEFAAYLQYRGYSRSTARVYLWAAEEFAHWIDSEKLVIEKIDERLTQLFLINEAARDRPPTAKLPRKNVHSALRHFLTMLRASGRIPLATKVRRSSIGCVIAEYDRYLRDVAGLALSTRRYRERYIRRFLSGVFGDRPIRWEQLQPKDIFSFVTDLARSDSIAIGSAVATSLRSFLSWLQFRGHGSLQLSLAVPRVCLHTRASLPRVMTDEQLTSFLAHFDRSTRVGRRDYAMAVCQTDLGLRVGEVAAIRLDDINWHDGTINIAAGKSRRGRALPLPNRVGQALTDYLQHGRPATACRQLFVRYTVPPGSPVTRYLIRHVFCRAFIRVKGCANWQGTHVLRHTAATRMYNRGASLKEIGDILGHRRLSTTAAYSKVSRTQLAGVALPWPGEVQP